MNSLLEQIQAIVGSGGLLTGNDVGLRSDNWPPSASCQAMAVVRPSSTQEVSEVARLCHAANQTIVTHGGLTGLVNGAVTTAQDIVVSLERMRSIEPVDALNRTVVCDAGVPLQALHEAADDAGLMFPLDLGARGSCTIGGNLSTNAGGNSVIRYGMMREQVLGLEAVLADGTIISSLNTVIKNNTGYDLKQLFIGSEGTLGIVTRVSLRLRPAPRSRNTALVAVTKYERISRFLHVMDTALGGTLSAFEVLWNDFYSLIVADGTTHGLPLHADHPFYILLESTGSHEDIDSDRFQRALEEAFSEELIVDAVVAQSRQQRDALWAIRDDIEAMAEALEPMMTFDVSLSIAHMDDFVQEVHKQLGQRWPNYRMVSFGHLGDGNIHLVLTVGHSGPEIELEVENVVYTILRGYRGVISAEHGIGLLKRPFLAYSRTEAEIALMKTIKHALDPKGLLNPGKIFSSGDETGLQVQY